jgi:DNA (cytosine-5)-methyltransferase 1
MSYNVTPQLNNNRLTMVELFCGGGIGGVGMKSAGYNVLAAYDFDPSAVKSYRHNLGDHVELIDINELPIETIPDADVVFGGPPCQDFSLAGGGRGEDGDRGKLVWRYLEIIEKKRPKAFIFENVKGLIEYKRNRQTFDSLVEEFEQIGYTVSWQLIMAWDYGVAQKRERVFIVGVRQNLGITYEFPQPNEADYRNQVLRDVIGDLPNAVDHYYTHNRNYKRQSVYSANEPSPTIRTVNRPLPNGYPGHPNDSCDINAIEIKPRRFTVRECLRIQSAPDWYAFPDGMSLTEQYRIVGNGVASRVSYLLGISLAEQLKL